jgi:hypothetical protein
MTAVLLAAALAAPGPSGAQPLPEDDPARQLARLMLEGNARASIEQQVGAGMMQAMASMLQERLHRRLQEPEIRTLAGIVQRFLGETLTPTRTEEIAADVYTRYFEPDELRELLAFQQSPVGRKTARLAPRVAFDTAQALDREIRRSHALPQLVDELRRAFPVLGPSESP